MKRDAARIRIQAFRELYQAVGDLSVSFFDDAVKAFKNERLAAFFASASLVRALSAERERSNSRHLLARIDGVGKRLEAKAAR